VSVFGVDRRDARADLIPGVGVLGGVLYVFFFFRVVRGGFLYLSGTPLSLTLSFGVLAPLEICKTGAASTSRRCARSFSFRTKHGFFPFP